MQLCSGSRPISPLHHSYLGFVVVSLLDLRRAGGARHAQDLGGERRGSVKEPYQATSRGGAGGDVRAAVASAALSTAPVGFPSRPLRSACLVIVLLIVFRRAAAVEAAARAQAVPWRRAAGTSLGPPWLPRALRPTRATAVRRPARRRGETPARRTTEGGRPVGCDSGVAAACGVWGGWKHPQSDLQQR